MKYLLLLFSIMFSMKSFAQNASATKSSPKEGMLFKLKFEHTDCSYEILVNDMPIVSHYGLGERSGLTVNLNQYILHPGKQNITIRIFPPKKDEKLFSTSLNSNSSVKIAISKNKEPMSMLDQMNAKDKGLQYQWIVLNYQTPKLESPSKCLEFKTSFTVDSKDVSWNINGWENGQTLQNTAEVRKEVDAFYAAFQKTLEDGDQQQYLSLLKKSIHEEAASTPWDGNAEQDLTTKMTKDYAAGKRSFIYPCQNAALRFYGEGKVVTLVCQDMLTYGYSPLISKSAQNLMPKAHTFYLYKPIGSDKLEVIR